MRFSILAIGFVAIAVGSSAVLASPSGSAKKIAAPQATVAAIMDDTGQALLWDVKEREYVIVRIGSRFQRFVVTQIDRNQVVLSHKRSRQHFVLPRTADTRDLRRRSRRAKVKRPPDPLAELENPFEDDLPSSRPGVTKPQIAPPAAPPASKKPAILLDPYASPEISVGNPGSSVADPYASPQQDTIGLPSPTKKGRKRVERHRVSRRQFEAAVGDFEALGRQIQVSLTTEGARIEVISQDSFFYRFGLRAGDVVQSVAGRKIRGVDDAAAIYARLAKTRRFVVLVRRDADTIKMRIRFTK